METSTDILAQFGGLNVVLGAIIAWLGTRLKAIKKLHNDFIPAILCATGGLVVCFFQGWSKNNFVEGIVTAMVIILGHGSLKGMGIIKKGEPETPTPQPPTQPTP